METVWTWFRCRLNIQMKVVIIIKIQQRKSIIICYKCKRVKEDHLKAFKMKRRGIICEKNSKKMKDSKSTKIKTSNITKTWPHQKVLDSRLCRGKQKKTKHNEWMISFFSIYWSLFFMPTNNLFSISQKIILQIIFQSSSSACSSTN